MFRFEDVNTQELDQRHIVTIRELIATAIQCDVICWDADDTVIDISKAKSQGPLKGGELQLLVMLFAQFLKITQVISTHRTKEIDRQFEGNGFVSTLDLQQFYLQHGIQLATICRQNDVIDTLDPKQLKTLPYPEDDLDHEAHSFKVHQQSYAIKLAKKQNPYTQQVPNERVLVVDDSKNLIAKAKEHGHNTVLAPNVTEFLAAPNDYSFLFEVADKIGLSEYARRVFDPDTQADHQNDPNVLLDIARRFQALKHQHLSSRVVVRDNGTDASVHTLKLKEMFVHPGLETLFEDAKNEPDRAITTLAAFYQAKLREHDVLHPGHHKTEAKRDLSEFLLLSPENSTETVLTIAIQAGHVQLVHTLFDDYDASPYKSVRIDGVDYAPLNLAIKSGNPMILAEVAGALHNKLANATDSDYPQQFIRRMQTARIPWNVLLDNPVLSEVFFKHFHVSEHREVLNCIHENLAQRFNHENGTARSLSGSIKMHRNRSLSKSKRISALLTVAQFAHGMDLDALEAMLPNKIIGQRKEVTSPKASRTRSIDDDSPLHLQVHQEAMAAFQNFLLSQLDETLTHAKKNDSDVVVRKRRNSQSDNELENHVFRMQSYYVLMRELQVSEHELTVDEVKMILHSMQNQISNMLQPADAQRAEPHLSNLALALDHFVLQLEEHARPADEHDAPPARQRQPHGGPSHGGGLHTDTNGVPPHQPPPVVTVQYPTPSTTPTPGVVN